MNDTSMELSHVASALKDISRSLDNLSAPKGESYPVTVYCPEGSIADLPGISDSLQQIAKQLENEGPFTLTDASVKFDGGEEIKAQSVTITAHGLVIIAKADGFRQVTHISGCVVTGKPLAPEHA